MSYKYELISSSRHPYEVDSINTAVFRKGNRREDRLRDLLLVILPAEASQGVKVTDRQSGPSALFSRGCSATFGDKVII